MSIKKIRNPKSEIRNLGCILIIALLGAGAVRSFAQTVPAKQEEAKLIAVLKSADASHKEKVDACRGLSLIGTRKAIAPLAALLGDEKLSHMARYGLEPIQDPAVDDALRDALGELKGRPLVGVIGSIGVRRDATAVKPLTTMLEDPDAEVAQAAARALGKIANQPATRALQRALRGAPAANQLAICEGLFRCAEAHGSEGQRDVATEIYDQLRESDAPHQVRGGALRGAILARGKAGVTLLREHLRSDDYILFSAACQTALEMPGSEVTGALTVELNKLGADSQILVIWTLGQRADPAALPTLFALAKKGQKNVRLEAIRALPRIGDASAVPLLAELMADSDSQISQTAQEALAALPGREADAAVMAMLNSSDSSQRLLGIELTGRRRMTTSLPALLKAARDPDPRTRPAAIKMVGELGSPAELPTLLDLLTKLEDSQELDAARQALSDVCAKTDDPESYTEKLTSVLAKAQPAQKVVLLRVLSGIGGLEALRAVSTWIGDSDPEVNTAAIRALSTWKDVDAAPILLTLAQKFKNPNDKTLCLRGFLGFASRGDLPANQRLSMCRQAADLIQRNDEKKLLLGALGSIDSPDALALIGPHLNDPAVRAEAATASLAIATRLLKRRDAAKLAPKLVEHLEKVANATAGSDLARRANALLKQAKSGGRRR